MRQECKCQHNARNSSFDDKIGLFKNEQGEDISYLEKNVQNAIELLVEKCKKIDQLEIIVQSIIDSGGIDPSAIEDLSTLRKDIDDLTSSNDKIKEQLNLGNENIDLIRNPRDDGKIHLPAWAINTLRYYDRLQEDQIYVEDENVSILPIFNATQICSSDAAEILVAASIKGAQGDGALKEKYTDYQLVALYAAGKKDPGLGDDFDTSDATNVLMFCAACGAGKYSATDWEKFYEEKIKE